MLEAMATGLPVFATTHGGIPEAVEHGVNGVLVPEGDHEALGRALLELAADPARLTAMGAAASKSVAENFDLPAQVGEARRRTIRRPSRKLGSARWRVRSTRHHDLAILRLRTSAGTAAKLKEAGISCMLDCPNRPPLP